MKNIWRLVSKPTETLPRFSPQISRIRALIPQVSNPISQVSNPNSFLIQIPKFRYFSSTSVVDSRLVDIFSKPASLDELKITLDSLDIKLDQESVHSVLKKLETIPESARKFFDWVLDREVKENRVLRSKSYNKMLEIVGLNGDLKEFWDLNSAMEKKGYKISKETYMKVCERLKNDRMDKDLEMLNKMYSTSYSQNIASRVRGVLSKDDEKFEIICCKLENLGIRFKSDLIADVLDQIGAETKKALVFFKWVEANPKIRIDGRVLNAVARVLGREDCISDFWNILQKMQDLGHNIERDTYVKVINRLYKRKMINEVVKLYEFAMNSSEKPPVDDFSFHLRKILTCKELDVSLVTKIVRIYLNSGNSRQVIDKSFDGYLKSLRSVERLGECLNVLKAMQAGGYEPDASVHGKIVVGLSNAKKLSEALDYADKLGRSGLKLDLNTWSSFVQKAYNAGEFDKVSRCFEKMVGIIGTENAKPAFDVLIHELCHKKNAKHATIVFKDTIVRKNIRPWHATYKFLIEKLLNAGNYEEATDLLMLMKEHDFPPFIDPFIVYISKSGTADDAMILLKAIASNEYPSTNVYIQLFEALIKEGRHRVANDLHSMAPSSVHNHEDVLNLLCLKKPDEAAIAAAL